MDATAAFELRILGPTELRAAGRDVDDAGVRAPKRLALLAYLALETADGFRRRDRIVGFFWPDLDQDAARAQLRKGLGAFRETFGADVIVSRGEGEIRLDPDRLWCDALALGRYVKDDQPADALALYRGELLDGFYPEGVAQEFQEWLAEKRRLLRKQAANAAWQCAQVEEDGGDRRAAAVMARRAIQLDPDDEEGVRRLMGILDRHGDRAGALRAYGDFQTRLLSEFNVEPAPETRKLARRIQAARKGESHETAPTRAAVLPANRDSVHAPGSRSHPVRRFRFLGAVAILAVVAAFGGWWSLGKAGPLPLSLAVLPIRAIEDVQPAASALTEELTTALAGRGDLEVHLPLRVAGANGSSDGSARPSAEGVSYVVDGAVQREGEHLRITLRLLRSRDALALWAASYDIDASRDTGFATRVAADAAATIRQRLGRPAGK